MHLHRTYIAIIMIIIDIYRSGQKDGTFYRYFWHEYEIKLCTDHCFVLKWYQHKAMMLGNVQIHYG